MTRKETAYKRGLYMMGKENDESSILNRAYATVFLETIKVQRILQL